MRALIKEAERQGVNVRLAKDLNGALGYHSLYSNLILLQDGMHRHQTRVVFGHELGHSKYGHTDSSPRSEYQADLYATKLLINEDVYASLERINEDPYWIAYELEITPDLILFYRHQVLALR